MSKIYIETDITELPKGCGECDFKYTNQTKEVTYYRCDATMQVIQNIDNTRPEWCPLKQGMLVDDDELSIGGTGENE